MDFDLNTNENEDENQLDNKINTSSVQMQDIEKTSHLNELFEVSQKMILKNVIKGLDRKEKNSVFSAGLSYMLSNKFSWVSSSPENII